MSLSDKIDFFPIEQTTYQKTLPQLSKTVPSNFGWHADKYLPLRGLREGNNGSLETRCLTRGHSLIGDFLPSGHERKSGQPRTSKNG